MVTIDKALVHGTWLDITDESLDPVSIVDQHTRGGFADGSPEEDQGVPKV